MLQSPKPAPTVDSYIAGLPPDVEHIMTRLRAIIHAEDPDVRESIKYGMPLFEYGGTYLYLGAWKHHIGLYPIHPLNPALDADLAPYRAKKDTVQFLYKKPVPYELFERLIKGRTKST